ncbi:iron-containing alcohol dehydrogenase [uncultured Ilyobacter sp.]|uniref:iron-containing alcohol dehydrogenase family protein n=1 Tax=uncultured Ilyobacter sp. TaxID=544433 RepID=UPI0029F4A5CA|nr:iron-containing alcohol dehydrogenase [uncultured Ilyobacter sp.]
MNFIFDIPATVFFGDNKIIETGKLLKGFGTTKTMIVCDQAMLDLGFVDKVVSYLEEENIEYVIFDSVMPNPTDLLVHEGAKIAEEKKIDSFVAIGGGSVIDSAKAINILLTNKGKIADYEGINKVIIPTLPLIMIPTTSGTASEVTSVSVVTDTKHHKKMVIAGQFVGGNIALCDPALTMKLPKSITASTGMDALTHAIEAYVSKWSSPVTDALALKSIKLIMESLEEAVTESSKTSREKMMLGSVTAGMSFNSALLGLVHSLAHPLSAHYGIAHGVANAIFLPYVVEYNIETFGDKLKPLAESMGIQIYGLDEKTLADSVVNKLLYLSKTINIPKLKSLNVPKEDFKMLAEEALVELSTMTNPKETNVNDLIKLLEKAYLR